MISPAVIQTSLHRRPGNGEVPIAEDAADDAEVIRAVLEGDVERYATLVRRYRVRYGRYAAQVAGSPDAGEDALQEAFIRAYDRLGRCRDPGNFRGWFFLILRNCCFAEARARRRLVEFDHPVAGPEPVAPGRPDGEVEAAEWRRRLQRALVELTPVQREVFALKHLEGLSYEEMAARLQTSVASLKMRMHRAYDRLRAALKEEA
jgi:RNA polymerase sigma-70 factor (ECF subfamily)